MTAIAESLYLSVLLFAITVFIVTFAILLMPCFLGRRNEQKSIVFYFMALAVLLLAALSFAALYHFFGTFGDYSNYILITILSVALALIFMVINKARKCQTASIKLLVVFSLLIFLLNIILSAEVIHRRSYMVPVTIISFSGVIIFYVMVFSSLSRICHEIMPRSIFKEKRKRHKIKDVL